MSTVVLMMIEQFGDMIVKVRPEENQQSTGVVRMRDVARIELGSQQYGQTCTLDGRPSVALSIFQLPVSNAIKTANSVRSTMEDLKKRFPDGLDYKIVYDTTPFIQESIVEVFKTFRDALILVAIVMLVFLQNWRAALIPLVAVPVAIIGTFAVMSAVGFSLNNLSLFGLVLAIGIVVDDAIVVVENVERWLDEGLPPKEAAVKAMDEVTGAVVAVALVLAAVFIPCAFISGITGEFFRQFAVTVAVSTAISAFNSLTLSPALASLLLKPRGTKRDPLAWLLDVTLGWFFKLFNWSFGVGTKGYTAVVARLLRVNLIVLVLYGGLLGLTYWMFQRVPTGFVPQQDKGYLLVNVQLPDGAALNRTEHVVNKVSDLAREIGGVAHTVGIAGQSILLNANAPSYGSMYVMLEPFDERLNLDRSADAIAEQLTKVCREEVSDGVVSVFGAPPIDGLGVTAGKVQLLEGVELTAEPGAFVAVVGPNGAGKSTLLKTLLGLLKPATGEVSVGERQVSELSGRDRAALLSWLPQRDAGVEPVRAIDRVAAARFRFDEGRASSLEAASRALAAMDIAALSERLVDTLSGGEAQRVALAALAAQEATWWLLDEPAHHLDPARQVAVYRTLGERWRAGQGMVAVTHDVNLLAHAAPGEHAERLLVLGLANGEVQFQVPLADPALAERLTTLFGATVRAVDVDGVRRFVVLGESP